MTYTSEKLLTIVIPNYNYADYIEKCINSVIEQVYQNTEIIVVDDCSSDNSIEVVSRVKDDRIRVIRRSANYGLPLAHLHGMLEAKGEFILFLDADDFLIDIHYFSRAIELLNSNTKAVAVCARATREELSANNNCETTSVITTSDLIRQDIIPFGTLIARTKDVFQTKALESPAPYMLDYPYKLKLSTKGRIVMMNNFIAMYYRQHPSSVSSNSERLYSNSTQTLIYFLLWSYVC